MSNLNESSSTDNTPLDTSIGSGPYESLQTMQSAKTKQRLNQIDLVRATGIGDHISLPQLVVSGDQSSGKSSVLVGVSGIPFPRDDGLCTRFATEIVLRHTSEPQTIKASINPNGHRDDQSKERLKLFQRELNDFSELPKLIKDAGKLMGLRSEEMPDGPAFSQDVLRIQVTGDTGSHLTIVDLPGIISVANEDQTEADIKVVRDLVDSYLESPRTIVLAVVQASNDIANQAIIQRARRFDPEGVRTIGVITKPDMVNKGTESRIALLARNLDSTKLKLGYFLVKNPSPEQLKAGISIKERKENERHFFATDPWKSLQLERTRLGVDNLREFLQDILDKHIERELPTVRKEIQKLLADTQRALIELGEERTSIKHMQTFLTKLSMRFCEVTVAAMDGNYQGSQLDFFGREPSMQSATRLRARVHKMNGTFADDMRIRSQKRKIVAGEEEDSSDESPLDEAVDEDHDQISVTRKQFLDWVKKVYVGTRGRELPGNYNWVLLSELFHEQSSRWGYMAREHVDELATLVETFTYSAIDFIVRDDDTRARLKNFIAVGLQQNLSAARKDLDRILDDENGQPITYNHYYTDNIQKARQDAFRKLLNGGVQDMVTHDFHGKLHVSNTSWDLDKLVASLHKRVLVDMDEQACDEVAKSLAAYYKVARKIFVDNVARQVVERHILKKLPRLFAPDVVSNFDDETILSLASEPERNQIRRKELTELSNSLVASLKHLRA